MARVCVSSEPVTEELFLYDGEGREMAVEPVISIIVPNFNGRRTIGKCLDSIFAFDDSAREVIVIDDRSEDGSSDIARQYPCRLIQFEKHAGASAARNAGAFSSSGDVLFFIDADCLIKEDTLSIIRKRLSGQPEDLIIGGTYTPVPFDPGFFSRFQSAFINYFETKKCDNPDYLATHALAIRTETFKRIGGFKEDFLPILEDVEFCHRLRRAGCRLMVEPELQVQHIFYHSFTKSIRNAIRKTQYWIMYSLENRDLFSDSGTASREIKLTGVAWLVTVLDALFVVASGRRDLFIPLLVLWSAVIFKNRRVFLAFYKAGGFLFAIKAMGYYLTVYPAAIWIGAFKGMLQYITRKTRQPERSAPAHCHHQDP
jgi:GT2 family glycosyltransferase